jgi:hypothetical protein
MPSRHIQACALWVQLTSLVEEFSGDLKLSEISSVTSDSEDTRIDPEVPE